MKVPIKVKSLNHENMIKFEIITEVPVEFNEDESTMAWKLMRISNNKFVGIIGQNLLKPIGAKLNLKEGYIEINNRKTYFENYDSKSIWAFPQYF